GGWLFGELGVLPQTESLLGPVEFRRNEQVDEDAFLVAPVNAVVELGVFFHAAAGAAPEGFVLGVESLPRARRERDVILRVAGLGLDGAQTHVQQAPLIVVEIAGVSAPTVEMTRQLEHVVGATTFGGGHAALEFGGQHAR